MQFYFAMFVFLVLLVLVVTLFTPSKAYRGFDNIDDVMAPFSNMAIECNKFCRLIFLHLKYRFQNLACLSRDIINLFILSVLFNFRQLFPLTSVWFAHTLSTFIRKFFGFNKCLLNCFFQ